MNASQPTVCFVEDSELDFEMATLGVRRVSPSVRVVQATTFDGTVRALGDPTLKLLVLDINLPEDNGIAILRRLQEAELVDGVGVVVFSTSTNPLERAAALAAGAQGYYVKPSSASDYLDTIRDITTAWV